MSKVLITGAFGFIGSNLSRYLINHTLIAIDLQEVSETSYSSFYSWDNINAIPWTEIDCIIHLAGIAHETKNQSDREEYFNVNAGLSKKIFNFFLQSSAKKFIYFSSVKAAADRVEGILTEDVTPSPRGPYGESKLAAELYLLKWHRAQGTEHSDQDNNILFSPEMRNLKQIYILRPCMIHGPGNRGNLNGLVNLIKKGIPYPLGMYDNRRSFTSFENLCYVINELLNRDIPSGIYNMADDEPVSINDLVRLIAEVSGKRGRIWNINRKFVNILAVLGSIADLPFNKDTLQKLTENYMVSNEKIKRALQISKMPIEAKEGLRKTIDAMIHH
jgi:nucleoside-diphosphate-sugar epimerase